jgi:sialate O-acetylesterase
MICMFAVATFALFPGIALSQVQVSPLFGDHAVLQRGASVPIWGTAEPGETVTVRVAGRSASTAANAKGRWIARLTDLPVGGPYTLIVTGTTTEVRSVVMVGDVWLASGQSNMSFRLMDAPAPEYDAVMASASDAQLSMFVVPIRSSAVMESDVGYVWQPAAPESVRAWSAVAYLFARELRTNVGVPIGILTAAVPATSGETWTSTEALATEPELINDAQETYKRRFPNGGNGASVLPGQFFNGMIAPLIPYAIRGAIWYQGENNASAERPQHYQRLLSLLIRDWRQRWGQGNFPFEIVQLHNIDPPGSARVGLPVVREAQLLISETLPNVGLAVAIDTGDGSLHPPDKRLVAHRLVLAALENSYGEKIESSGPLYAGFEVVGSEMHVTFTHLGGGLVARDGALRQFEIAGADKVFVPAVASINGNEVFLSSPQVASPVAARYAMAPNPTGCNLYNRAGLPASPFRTDNW